VAAHRDHGGLLYGAVVSGATLGAVSAHADATTRVAVSTLVVLVVYWLAHVYVDVLADQLQGDTRMLPSRYAASLTTEVAVLVGGLPTVAVYCLAAATGVDPSTAGYIALTFLICLLFTVGFIGARRAGLSGGMVLVEALAAGCFGVLIMAMKALLH
jgi:hypothetical protein